MFESHLKTVVGSNVPRGKIGFTGMGAYIDPDKIPPHQQYHDTQRFHPKRYEIREAHIIPILKTILQTEGGKGIIAEMGPADGLTSTIDIVRKMPDAKIDAIEIDPKYYARLVSNMSAHKLVRPLNVGIESYEPEISNSVDALVSFGGFTDSTPYIEELIEILKTFREKHLKPGAPVILEEELPPYYDPIVPYSREKSLAIQRGHVIFNALMGDKVDPKVYAKAKKEQGGINVDLNDPYVQEYIVPLNEREIEALVSSLAKDRFGDYKLRLSDFKYVFEAAGFKGFTFKKLYPCYDDFIPNLVPEKLIVDPNTSYEEVEKQNTAMAYYNFIFNQMLLIANDESVINPQDDPRFKKAVEASNKLYTEMKKYKDYSNGIELLEKHLGLQLMPGQNLSSTNDLKSDKTGGNFLLIAWA